MELPPGRASDGILRAARQGNNSNNTGPSAAKRSVRWADEVPGSTISTASDKKEGGWSDEDESGDETDSSSIDSDDAGFDAAAWMYAHELFPAASLSNLKTGIKEWDAAERQVPESKRRLFERCKELHAEPVTSQPRPVLATPVRPVQPAQPAHPAQPAQPAPQAPPAPQAQHAPGLADILYANIDLAIDAFVCGKTSAKLDECRTDVMLAVMALIDCVDKPADVSKKLADEDHDAWMRNAEANVAKFKAAQLAERTNEPVSAVTGNPPDLNRANWIKTTQASLAEFEENVARAVAARAADSAATRASVHRCSSTPDLTDKEKDEQLIDKFLTERVTFYHGPQEFSVSADVFDEPWTPAQRVLLPGVTQRLVNMMIKIGSGGRQEPLPLEVFERFYDEGSKAREQRLARDGKKPAELREIRLNQLQSNPMLAWVVPVRRVRDEAGSSKN